jgi:peptidoglycan hydrolase-like protein with peptidoglycan-binding domain
MAFLKKYMWWIIAAIGAVIIYNIVSNRLSSPKDTGGGSVPLPGGGTTTVKFVYNPAKVDRKKVFGLGSKNSNEVAYLQTWLNQYYKSGLSVDGSWGAKTTAALLSARPLANIAGTTLDTLQA